MTISPWLIYIWGTIDAIIFAFGAAALITGILSCVAVAVSSDSNHPEGDRKICRKLAWISVPIFFVSCLLSTLLPDSKTLAMMVVVPAIINSEPIQKDLPEIYQLGINHLKKELGGDKIEEAKK